MHPTRRQKYWIDIRTQGPFLLKIASVWGGGVLFLCLLLYYLADEELGRSFYSVHLRLRNTWRILLPAVLVSGGVSYLLTILATILIALRESHRLGGPVYKFRLLFHDLQKGVFDTRFRFRKGDLLSDLADAYREALRGNAERIQLLRKHASRAERSLEGARRALDACTLPAEGHRMLEESAESLARLREALAEFRTGPS